ncbi:hypothetical protein HG536_0H03770 [Torulaspora globosa]|uniref:precorrin-2 dehydrogenase n=1 Tax=Torulaspora globosa TaxID=48254 RepID=A0A7G3ZNB5_9SACH|nr:uncharacterized protein HG536_0H03770 [Torulaspora globosa]QLL35001.1 hypothetical protein HG536_0H03770 [Torulaspora globosa]
MPGQSLLLAHRLEGKNVLLVGGGEVALTRLKKLIPTGSRVTLIAPEVHPAVWEKYCSFIGPDEANSRVDFTDKDWRAKNGIYRVIKEGFKFDYLDLYRKDNDSGWSLILTCIPDKPLSEEIYHESKRRFGSQQTVNVADNPPLCDVYFGAELNFGAGDDSRMQLMISSNGMGPRFVALVRDEIRRMLEGIDFESSLDNLGALRQAVRGIASNDSRDTKYRMNWMKRCTETFGIKNCENLNVEELTKLFEKMYNDDQNMQFPREEEMFEKYLQ